MSLKEYVKLLDNCVALYVSSEPLTIYDNFDKRRLTRYNLRIQHGVHHLVDAFDKKLTVCFEFKPGFKYDKECMIEEDGCFWVCF